jgi:hypothetical protein
MPNISGVTDKMVEIAKRCQLCTGSFTGNLSACGCITPAQCKLTPEERAKYSKEPAVKAQHEQNLVQFQKTTEQETI